jgi:hypothetical protein
VLVVEYLKIAARCRREATATKLVLALRNEMSSITGVGLPAPATAAAN